MYIFKDFEIIPEELDLVEEEDKFTHLINLDDAVDNQEMLSKFKIVFICCIETLYSLISFFQFLYFNSYYLKNILFIKLHKQNILDCTFYQINK